MITLNQSLLYTCGHSGTRNPHIIFFPFVVLGGKSHQPIHIRDISIQPRFVSLTSSASPSLSPFQTFYLQMNLAQTKIQLTILIVQFSLNITALYLIVVPEHPKFFR